MHKSVLKLKGHLKLFLKGLKLILKIKSLFYYLVTFFKITFNKITLSYSKFEKVGNSSFLNSDFENKFFT